MLLFVCGMFVGALVGFFIYAVILMAVDDRQNRK